MNDNEIKKALEEFQNRILKTNLSYYIFESEMMAVVNALDLINRQQAEIERLKNEIKGFDNFLKETDCSLKEIRDNAIKDCVNKYTEMLIDEYHLRTDLQIANIKRLEQKILTEKVGEQNEKSN